jgi:hypothetical protein
MTKFKIGTTKTRDGTEVRIYSVDGGGETPIHGAYKWNDHKWAPCQWYENGRLDCDKTQELDLVYPEVEIYEFECEWLGGGQDGPVFPLDSRSRFDLG